MNTKEAREELREILKENSLSGDSEKTVENILKLSEYNIQIEDVIGSELEAINGYIEDLSEDVTENINNLVEALEGLMNDIESQILDGCIGKQRLGLEEVYVEINRILSFFIDRDDFISIISGFYEVESCVEELKGRINKSKWVTLPNEDACARLIKEATEKGNSLKNELIQEYKYIGKKE